MTAMIETTAYKFIESVVAAYRRLTSYRDIGIVRGWNDRTRTEDIFCTHFARPSRYRFDFLSSHPHPDLRQHTIYHAIVSDENRVLSYMRPVDSRAQLSEEVSLGEAVAKLTGVSLGAAYVVPRLLIDDIPGGSIRDFHEHRWDDDVVISGVPCKQVHCVSPIGQCTIAIEMASLLIRRIHNSGQDFEVEETRSDILTNCKVDENLFREPVAELLP
jgi:hypothetical protein